MEDFKIYKVGGCVRDNLLGLQPKDIDYVFVFNKINDKLSANEYYLMMKDRLVQKGIKIYQERPDCFTIRGKYKTEDVDFVMARKETYPDPKTRIPHVTIGTLEDDQARRDFTVNAMAQGLGGEIIDLFNGQQDLVDGILRTPKDTVISFNDDPLRILRAIRFSITKSLQMSDDMVHTIELFDADRMKVVSAERIREELYKCFKYSTKGTLSFLFWIRRTNFPLYDSLIPEGFWFEPTNKK